VCDTVAVFDLGSQVACFLLDVQRRHASADGILVIGSGLEFEDRGIRQLKGVPWGWRISAVASP
jgi:hypothetical protein